MQLLSSLSFLLFHSLLLGALGWRRFGTSSRKYASTRSGDKHMTLHAKHTLDGQEIDGDLQPVTNFCLVKVKESLEETVRDVPLFFFSFCSFCFFNLAVCFVKVWIHFHII